MERFPWHPRLRHAGIARRLVIAAVTALTLAVVAAVGMAATSATPNGCPTDKSTKPAPIAQLSPPARLQIAAFDVLSGPVNEGTDSFTLKVRIGSTCSRDVIGASVYVTAVPYNQFSIPAEELTGNDGTAILVFRRDANFPASDQQQQLTLFIRATKPGEDPSPVSRHGGSSRSTSRANAVPCARPRPSHLAARPSHLQRSTTVSGVLLWTDPQWLAEAYTWIRERLEALGVRPTGDIEQPHVRPWSTVMRVPTSGGDVWFKANIPALAYEAGVVGVLARTRPDLLPELAAVDLERGWMLMGDGGERLRELVERERNLERWLDVLAPLRRAPAQHGEPRGRAGRARRPRSTPRRPSRAVRAACRGRGRPVAR